MYSNKPIIYRKERRQKPDLICLWLQYAGAIVWLILLAVVFIVQQSQPRTKTFWDRLLSVQVRSTWDYSKLGIVFYLLIFLFVLSIVSLIFNFLRLKRSTDRIRISFIISLVGSIVGIIIYLFDYMA